MPTHFLLSLWLLLLAVVVAPPRVSGVVLEYYLDASAGSGGSGSETDPFGSADQLAEAIATNIIQSEVIAYIRSGTYTLSSPGFVVMDAHALTFVGPTLGVATFVCSIQSSFLDYLGPAGALSLNDITISGCLGDNPALRISAVSTTLTRVTVNNCSSLIHPRTVISVLAGSLNVLASQFIFNPGRVLSFISNNGDDAMILSSRFSYNTGVGVSMMDLNNDNAGRNDLINIVVDHNVYDTSIIAISDAALRMEGSLLEYNSAQSVLAYNSPASSAWIIRSEFRFNTVSQGALLNGQQATVTLLNTSTWQNTADVNCPNGGSINNQEGVDLCLSDCPSGKRMDRCNVCDGADACVGCDNIPWGSTTCPAFDLPDVFPTLPDAIVEWPGDYPAPVLILSGTAYSLDISVDRLEEQDPSGNVISTLYLRNISWFITSSATNSTYTRRFAHYVLGTPTVLTIDNTFFYTGAMVNSGIVQFQVEDLNVKVSFKSESWQFASAQNSLVLFLSFTPSEQTTGITSSLQTIDNFDLETLSYQTPNTLISVTLQRFAVFDGTTRDIAVGTNGSSSSSTPIQYSFTFPAPFDILEFDPDFSMLVTPSSSGGDGDGTDIGLVVGLSVSLPLACAFVVTAILLGTIAGWITRKRIRAKMKSQEGLADMEITIAS